MKIGNLLALTMLFVCTTTGIATALFAAHPRSAGSALLSTMSATAFVLAAVIALVMHGISKAAEDRLTTEVLHP